MSAREMTVGMLMALPEDQQAAYWRALIAHWQANREAELDADFAADHSDHRRAWEGSW